MQYIPCNSALLAQETLFLTQKGPFFAQRSPKSAYIATNLNSRQYSVCSGLKFSPESKLFGAGPPCPRTNSATLRLTKIQGIPISVPKGEKTTSILRIRPLFCPATCPWLRSFLRGGAGCGPPLTTVRISCLKIFLRDVFSNIAGK